MSHYSYQVLFLVFSAAISRSIQDSVVNTKYGVVFGSVRFSRNSRIYYSFQGIPYAKPPVGNLRFKAPQPPTSWTIPLNATVDGPVCLQKQQLGTTRGQIIGQEDCLYLNVYVPRCSTNRRLLPVMVWIHGGALIFGSGSSTVYGPEYFMDAGVILVTLNYRLGVFGFLSTLDDEAPGNWALKDQVLALSFVKKNIKSFGGDPNKITLFGESAGSWSVSLHMVSPLSRGVFQRAICQSGIVLNLHNDTQNELQTTATTSLAKNVSCAGFTGQSKKLLECLRKVDAVVLAKAQQDSAVIVLEKKTSANRKPFIQKSPRGYIESDDFSKIPWIVGIVQDEGIIMAASLTRQKALLDFLNSNFKTNFINIFGLQSLVANASDVGDLYKNITNFYLGGDNFLNVSDSKRVQGFINFCTDILFMYDTYKSVIVQAKFGQDNIWVYNFNYRGNNTHGDLYAQTTADIDFQWGVAHGDDLMYLFKATDPDFSKVLTGTDVKMSKDMITLWTNFAISGNPDPRMKYNWGKTQFGPGVENIKNENLHFMDIGGKFGKFPKYRMEIGFYKSRMEFWSKQNLRDNLSLNFE